MKKIMVLGAAMCVAMAFTSCKSSESAYRKAYDKAQAQEAAYNNNENANKQADTDVPVVAPVEQKSVDQTAVVDNNDNVPVRHENVSYESGEPLRPIASLLAHSPSRLMLTTFSLVCSMLATRLLLSLPTLTVLLSIACSPQQPTPRVRPSAAAMP